MTRSELVRCLSRHYGVTHREAAQILSTCLETISEALCNGDRVELRGFGVFAVRRPTDSPNRDSRTGQTPGPEERRLPRFRVSKELKTALSH